MVNTKKLYLGTTNPAKVNAVKEVLSDFEVVSISVNSGVDKQPKSDEETIQGAINRALSLPSDGLRMGLEAGVTIHQDRLYLINWGALIDQDGKIFTAGGTRIELPKYVKDKIFNEGEELADVMGEVFKDSDIRKKQGAIGIYTCGLVNRKDIFTHIVKLLYGQYLFDKEQK